MAKRIYIGTGTARNVRSLYIGVNGSARRIKAGYMGNANAARKFWPKGYMWNYYSIQYQYNEIHGESSKYNHSAAYGTWQYTTSWYIDNSTGVFVVTQVNTASYFNDIPYGARVTGYEWGGTSCTVGNHSVMYEFYEIQVGGTYRSSITLQLNTSNPQIGSHIGQIISENRNAYPDNGISGSYWYIYQGET